jgi:hypothetical protein
VSPGALCLLAAGIFFGTGLLTGVWKYFRDRLPTPTLSPVPCIAGQPTSKELLP